MDTTLGAPLPCMLARAVARETISSSMLQTPFSEPFWPPFVSMVCSVTAEKFLNLVIRWQPLPVLFSPRWPFQLQKLLSFLPLPLP